jgi:PleD family two-component response regulator
VARLRWQEFAVLLPGHSAQRLSELAECLRANMPQMIVNEDSLPVTLSMGIGMFYPGETSWTKMLSRADVALLCAKNNGPDRVVLASASTSNPAERRTGMLQVAT